MTRGCGKARHDHDARAETWPREYHDPGYYAFFDGFRDRGGQKRKCRANSPSPRGRGGSWPGYELESRRTTKPADAGGVVSDAPIRAARSLASAIRHESAFGGSPLLSISRTVVPRRTSAKTSICCRWVGSGVRAPERASSMISPEIRHSSAVPWLRTSIRCGLLNDTA